MARDGKLPDFEGDEVVKATVAILKAGDGLSQALDVDPVALRRGERVFYLLETHVAHVDHAPLQPGSDLLVRKHFLNTTAITRVDGALAEPILVAAADELEKALEHAAGVMRLEEAANG
jgi:hypothetical protein